MYALYSGMVAEPGDRNPYDGQSLLARLWRVGYSRMMRIRIETGPAMQRYYRARRVAWIRLTVSPHGRLAPRSPLGRLCPPTSNPPR